LSYRFRHKSGQYVRVLDRWSVERDGQGRATRVSGTMVNLSMRAAAIDTARLRLALAAGQVGTWDWDLTTNEWSLDARCRAILGLPDLGPEGFLHAVHAEDRENVAKRLEEIRLDTEVDYDDTFRIVRQPNSSRWVTVKGKVMSDGDDRRL